MKVALLTVGDEILIGQIVNTNAAWMATELNRIGADVIEMRTVGDTTAAICGGLADSLLQADVVLMTGGLGPTHDDITKDAVAQFFGLEMEYHEEIFDRIRQMLERRGRVISDLNKVQALVPKGFEIVNNPVGTAPGLWYETLFKGRKRVICLMPGVPYEMKAIMQRTVLPRLKADVTTVIAHKTLLTAGIGESNLAEMIGDVRLFLGEGATLAFLPNPQTGVRLRLSVRGTDAGVVATELDKGVAYLQQKTAAYWYGEDEETPEIVLGKILKNKTLTLAVAESCTGGLIASRITDVAGASAYFKGSVVAYDSNVKVQILGVSAQDIATQGVVSEATARQMAEGADRSPQGRVLFGLEQVRARHGVRDERSKRATL